MKSTSSQTSRPRSAITRGRRAVASESTAKSRAAPDVAQVARDALLAHCAPPAVVIDHQQQVIFRHGDTTPFLKPGRRKIEASLLSLARPAYRKSIESLLDRLATARRPGPDREVVAAAKDGQSSVVISFAPLLEAGVLVTFAPEVTAQAAVERRSSPKMGKVGTNGDADGHRLDRHPHLLLQGIRDHAIFMLDLAGRVASWSAGAEQLFGYREGEILQRRLNGFLDSVEPAQNGAKDILAIAAAESVAPIERWQLRKDGSRFWGSGTVAGVRGEGGELVGFVSILRDQTERKREEDALREAMRNAEAANASKDHFLANVSHELRTPMSATLLWAKLLSDQTTMDPDLLREGLAAINRSAKEQQVLIEDLMDTAKIVAGKMRLEPRRFDLNRLVQTLLPPIRGEAVQSRVVIDDRLDPAVGVVEGDPRRIQQVVANLLNNSVKFTPAGGRITVVTQRRGDEVQIRVIDTGKGIGKEFLHRIFDRFVQVEHGTAPTASGMGLGLAIARQLVELHGGTIRAESAGRDQGSTFVIDLPLARQPEGLGEDRDDAEQEVDLAGWRVLLVEDSTQTRDALAKVLTEGGAQVTASGSDEEALAAYDAAHPDLILSDIGLGTSSGHQLIAEIRRRENDRGQTPVPAMALTAYADDTTRRQAFECGFHDCATKPIEPRHLLVRLSNLRAKR